jgi:hypothetical protein
VFDRRWAFAVLEVVRFVHHSVCKK